MHRRTIRLAAVLAIVILGHALFITDCVVTDQLDGAAMVAGPLAAHMPAQAHLVPCTNDLPSVLPAPDRPTAGQGILPAPPDTGEWRPPPRAGAQPPGHPPATIRAFLQVYRI
jgi:hypothetical protein